MRPFEQLIPKPMRHIYLNEDAPFELRPVAHIPPHDSLARDPSSQHYLKLAAPAATTPQMNACLFAYISDCIILCWI